jgi:murein DD-endopeptidase MepM/ murein hydrolase activator NlpD
MRDLRRSPGPVAALLAIALLAIALIAPVAAADPVEIRRQRDALLRQDAVALARELARLDDAQERRAAAYAAMAGQAAEREARIVAGLAALLREARVAPPRDAAPDADAQARQRAARLLAAAARTAQASRLADARAAADADAIAAAHRAERQRRAAAIDTARAAMALRDLGAARLGRLAPGPAPSTPPLQAGRAHAPIDGRVLAGWNAAPGGAQRRGVVFAAEAAQPVVAPWHGRIAYAGRLRGYGAVLIVESADRYHWFVAGLDRVDVRPGQVVRPGEPVGRAGMAGGTTGTLYVELRRHGQPIDPGPWLATPNGKAKG